MKLVFVLSVLVGLTVALPPKWRDLTHKYSFEQYKNDFGKYYEGDDSLRRRLFAESMEVILAHNSKQSSYKMGVNHMTDWTDEERKQIRGYDKGLGQFQVTERQRKYVSGELKEVEHSRLSLPQNVDWREKGVVTAVKDQGVCGSCWTFSSAETIESHWAIKTGTLEVLSEQQIISCVENPQECGGTGGCQGGTVELAYSALSETGIASEWKYPYKSHNGIDHSCTWSEDQVGSVAQISGYYPLPPNNQEALMKAVAFAGPVAVTVDASVWGHYETGIFNDCNQSDPDLDHGVQLIGYGTDNGQDYWLIRNSWTPSYGENGFIRIARQSTVACGVDTQPLDGTACVGGPANVTVCGTCGVLYDSVFPIVDPYKVY